VRHGFRGASGQHQARLRIGDGRHQRKSPRVGVIFRQHRARSAPRVEKSRAVAYRVVASRERLTYALLLRRRAGMIANRGIATRRSDQRTRGYQSAAICALVSARWALWRSATGDAAQERDCAS